MNDGLLGAIVGSALGVLGAVIGTAAAIRGTAGPRERAFVVRASVLAWLATIPMVALLLWLPSPFRFFVWIPWAVLLPLAVLRMNATQRRIRSEEASTGSTPSGG
jgi:hypothetical protein